VRKRRVQKAKTVDYRGILLGVGNPLLDISAVVKQDLLDKYELKLNNAILADEKHQPLYPELIEKYDVEYIAGGATQNSIRVAQWMLQESGATSYFGCVGKDKYADELKKCAEADGVAVLYQVNEKVDTGRCAVCVKDKERSLVANLGAAATFTIDHLKTPDVEKVWKKAAYIYSSGFFLTSSAESAVFLAKHCHETGKTYAMNLAAPFICEFFNKPLLDCMPYVDIIFGNESESQAFGKAMKYEDTSPEAVAVKLAELPSANKDRPRVVIITQGSHPTIVVTGKDKKLTKYTVPPVPADEIVDANGAGDAFVGGYLSQLVRGKDIEKCVAGAHHAAGKILRVSGTVLKGSPEFE